LQLVQDCPLLCQLLGQLCHLGSNVMEQSQDRRFALFKGGMDFFILPIRRTKSPKAEFLGGLSLESTAL
jgi:hypothetical protein